MCENAGKDVRRGHVVADDIEGWTPAKVNTWLQVSSLSHTLSLTKTHSLRHIRTFSHSYTLTPSHPHTLTLSHSHTHTLTLSLSHSHTLALFAVKGLMTLYLYPEEDCEVLYPEP